MAAGIEPQVRRVVARRLGVSPRLLGPMVSLRGDLATENAVVTDLVLAVESRLGVSLPERVLDDVRTYGELVAATLEAVRERRAEATRVRVDEITARVRISGGDGAVIDRSGMLTPYLVEGIHEDARRRGPQAVVAITLTSAATDEQLAELRTRLSRLERRGASVRVGRGSESATRKTGS